MDALGAELAGEALCQGALGELAGGEGAELGASAEGGRGSGHDEGWRVRS